MLKQLVCESLLLADDGTLRGEYENVGYPDTATVTFHLDNQKSRMRRKSVCRADALVCP
jgi:hypothetical protein